MKLNQLQKKKNPNWLLFVILIFLQAVSCITKTDKKFNTLVSIRDSHWYFNDEIINPGSPAEGLLMNVRMVNAVFEDRGEELKKYMVGFNSMANTDAFISKIPEYTANGVNAFTVSLQGGLPGYEGAVNTAFNSDGTTREEYLQRVEKVIRACDANYAAVILSCFYQRQHSHNSAIDGKESIIKALENTVNWITEKKFTNVLLEVSNEYRHGGYRNWPAGEWLASEAGQAELIKFAKQLNPSLLVSTSGMGNGKSNDILISEADFILIHFNNTSLEDYQSKIEGLKKYGKPIVCNEDDKLMNEGAIALALSTLNGCGWGYMNIKRNQEVPFEFLGTNDDSSVYQMFRNVTTPRFKIDPESLKQTSVTITYPNDGMVFRKGQSVNIRLSHLYPDKSIPYSIEILANNGQLALVDNKLQASWQPDQTGVFVLEAVVKNEKGKELYRSSKVDIIVQPEQ